MSYFPFFTDVTNLHGVIIGGGEVATEKVERLLPFCAKLTVIAPKISAQLLQYQTQIRLLEKEYEKADLLDADYVIAATDNMKLNETIYQDAKERHLWINVVDVPALCDFIFPSVIQKGKLVIGVSTSGAGPQVAIRLRKKIEQDLPTDIESILDTLYEERIRAKEEIPDPKERRRHLIELANRLLDDEEK